MKEVDVLVIGGGPAAVITAVVAKQMNTDKHVVVVRNSPTVVIPCGIPYIFNTLKTVENDIMPDGAYKMNDIELIIDEAIDGDIDAKVIKLKTGQEIKYKKLVLATGSLPKIPKFIPGYEKEGVFYIYKNFDYLNQMLEKIANMKKIVIIGGGFIGMELADEFISQGEKEITIIEMEPHCLIQAFDQEFCEQVEEKFKDAGVNILTNTKLTAVMGDNKVEYVEIDGKKKIKAEAVIFSIGSRPNVELATKLGIRVDEKYGIWADEYLRTSHPDVFAVGDCTAKNRIIA